MQYGFGLIQRFEAPGWGLGADVPIQLWSPDGLDAERPTPLIVAHDGSAYARQHMADGDYNGPDLLGRISGLIEAGEVPPMRIALVNPVDRHRWYSASSEYSTVLALSVMCTVGESVATVRPIIGIGSSLGALSLVACEHQHPGTFDGLFLQSTSWHHPDYDNGENRALNKHYDRGKEFIEWFRGTPAAAHILDVSLTCGWEGNWDGNVALDQILDGQGHRSELRRVEGDHNLYWWGQTLTPHLGNLIRRCMYMATKAA